MSTTEARLDDALAALGAIRDARVEGGLATMTDPAYGLARWIAREALRDDAAARVAATPPERPHASPLGRCGDAVVKGEGFNPRGGGFAVLQVNGRRFTAQAVADALGAAGDQAHATPKAPPRHRQAARCWADVVEAVEACPEWSDVLRVASLWGAE